MTDSPTPDHDSPAPEPAFQPGGKLPPEIWVLVSAAFVIALGFGIVAPALPQFAREFGVGYTAASAVIMLLGTIFARSRVIPVRVVAAGEADAPPADGV